MKLFMKMLIVTLIIVVSQPTIFIAKTSSGIKKVIIERGHLVVNPETGEYICKKDSFNDTCNVEVVYGYSNTDVYDKNSIYYPNYFVGSLDAQTLSSCVLYDENGIINVNKKIKYNSPLINYSSIKDFLINLEKMLKIDNHNNNED